MRLVFCVLAGVAVLGRIAASYLPAIRTQAEMDPGIAQLHAFFTNMFLGVSDMQMLQVATG